MIYFRVGFYFGFYLQKPRFIFSNARNLGLAKGLLKVVSKCCAATKRFKIENLKKIFIENTVSAQKENFVNGNYVYPLGYYG